MSYETDEFQLKKRIKGLEKRLETYQKLVDDSQDLLYRTDLSGRITYVSPSVFRLSGYTVAEAIGMKMAEEVYAHSEERERFIQALGETGSVTNFQAKLKRKDGSIWWAMTNAHFLTDETGKTIGVEGITRDITDLKMAETALVESEKRFRTIIESSPMGIHRYELQPDNNLVFLGANPAADRLLGIDNSQFIGKTITEAFPQLRNTEVPLKYRQVCREGIHWQTVFIEYQDNQITGCYEVYAFQTEPLKMAAFFLDVTDKKKSEQEKSRLEQMLLQSQKFQSVGTLAGGIAHDFNNLLMGIQGHTALAMVDMDPMAPQKEHLEAVSEYVRAAADLTKQLLGFAQEGKYEAKPVDLNRLVENASSMFARTRKEIQMHTKLSNGLIVEADQGQIEQVLLNMFVNAWQAMPHGGKIYLETCQVDLNEAYCAPHQIAPGRFAKISVTDTGTGMSDPVRRQVFDPFFTTKEKGRGIGLGLASSYGIIKNHGGIITVYSEIGHGSTFNIYLPVSERQANSDIPVQAQTVCGSETVLLVDDERMIVDVGKAMLSKLGYTVLTAENGREAIDLFRGAAGTIDLVILDMIMPEMNGGAVFDGIRQIEPDIPILLSSGYAMNNETKAIMDRGCNGFIQKPFNLSELSVKLRQILDSDD